jgi:hypothetical protein
MWRIASDGVEWWTVHAHLVTAGGDERGLSVRFLRHTNANGHQHAVLLDGSAKSHVDTAWAALEPLLPNTFTKVVVRALGHYAALRERDPVAVPV